MASLVATLLAIILALLRVAPATLRAVEDRRQREREAEADRRLQEKDARVAAALAATKPKAFNTESAEAAEENP